MRHNELTPEMERISHAIIGCAIEVHRELGPGLLEKLYEQALQHELELGGHGVQRQVEVRVPYKGILLEAQRIDLIVDGLVVVELKCVRALEDVHMAQTLSYLRMTALPLGLTINFNHAMLRDGVRRVINERSKHLPSSSLRELRVPH